MSYFKRDPAGAPHEIQQIYAKRLFANLQSKEVDDALGHAEGNQPGVDTGSDSDTSIWDRRRHVVSVISKLFAEVADADSESL